MGKVPILRLFFAEIATIKGIRIYFVFPVFVMLRHIFTNSQLLKSAKFPAFITTKAIQYATNLQIPVNIV
ncbi:hypothetical protein AAH092_22820, partial [Bacteroides xylanisolvens]|uniref:hypothetical protein n=1 Tax=Bacteroides xylanisolvens TaxID=371601 RepID=UPI0039B5949E